MGAMSFALVPTLIGLWVGVVYGLLIAIFCNRWVGEIRLKPSIRHELHDEVRILNPGDPEDGEL